jgi:hypothetical protein
MAANVSTLLTDLRTHRERKEMYIKALEQEVLRLKEMFTTSTKERDAVVEENRRLKELLASHGISYDFASVPLTFSREDSNTSGYGQSTGGSTTGSYNRSESTNTNLSPPQSSGHRPLQPAPTANGPRQMVQLPNNNLNYDQLGIDFVLTYDSQGNPILPDPTITGAYPSPSPHR